MGNKDDIFNELLSVFGKDACTLEDKPLPEHKLGFLSTGSNALDWSLGGGIPYGRITEILGWQSSGKSVIAANLLASCQKKGGLAILLDTEHSLLSEWATTLGVDTSKLCILDTEYLEEAFDKIEIACNFAKEKKIQACLVVDSISVLPTKKQLELEKTEDTRALGEEARIISSALKKVKNSIWKSKVALVLVSQLREKIGVMFGSNVTTPGGNAIKFYSAVRIETHNRGFIYPKNVAKDDPIGMECRISIIKNKITRPRAPVETEILYDRGFDKIKDTVILGVKMNKILFHKGGYYEYQGEKLRMKQFSEKYKDKIKDGSLIKSFSE